MLNIEWRGNFGYGDMTDPLTCSHAYTVKFDTPVTITIHWPFLDPNYKCSSQDPDTVLDQFEYLRSILKRPKHPVKFIHKFRSDQIPFRYINNLEPLNPLTGVWYNNQHQTDNHKVVVWSSRYNLKSVSSMKDPVRHQWDDIIKHYTELGYEVVELTYRMPIKEAIDHINTCTFGVGYDGMVHQLFKYLWKPITVLTDQGRHLINRLLVPQAVVMDSADQLINTPVKDLYFEMTNRMHFVEICHKRYLRRYYDYREHVNFNKKQGQAIVKTVNVPDMLPGPGLVY